MNQCLATRILPVSVTAQTLVDQEPIEVCCTRKVVKLPLEQNNKYEWYRLFIYVLEPNSSRLPFQFSTCSEYCFWAKAIRINKQQPSNCKICHFRCRVGPGIWGFTYSCFAQTDAHTLETSCKRHLEFLCACFSWHPKEEVPYVQLNK